MLGELPAGLLSGTEGSGVLVSCLMFDDVALYCIEGSRHPLPCSLTYTVALYLSFFFFSFFCVSEVLQSSSDQSKSGRLAENWCK